MVNWQQMADDAAQRIASGASAGSRQHRHHLGAVHRVKAGGIKEASGDYVSDKVKCRHRAVAVRAGASYEAVGPPPIAEAWRTRPDNTDPMDAGRL